MSAPIKKNINSLYDEHQNNPSDNDICRLYPSVMAKHNREQSDNRVESDFLSDSLEWSVVNRK